MSEMEFLRHYSTEEECLQFFKNIIEFKGFSCNNCKSNEIVWKALHQYWRCLNCRSKMTIKSLTFMKNSKASYKEWLHAIFFILESKKPISTKELQRKLGCKYYKMVYYMAMKIRYELVRLNDSLELGKHTVLKKLDGVEISDGKLHSVPEKTLLFYKRIRKKSKLRMMISKYDYNWNRREFKLKSDKYSFKKLLIFQEQSWFNYQLKKADRKQCAINKRMDLVIQRNTNRVLEGIHHGVSRYHLQAYLDEFSFKYNNRKNDVSNFLLFCDNLEIGNHRPT